MLQSPRPKDSFFSMDLKFGEWLIHTTKVPKPYVLRTKIEAKNCELTVYVRILPLRKNAQQKLWWSWKFGLNVFKHLFYSNWS